ncbi:MAG: ABC transporter ATP-binding protein [Cyanobacteria bacterium P01_F01_bin.53]
MSKTILDVRNLKVEFDTTNGVLKAVDGISFQVKRGRTLGIVGESGSGKSVTSLSIMGLVPNPPGRITQGEILFSAQADTPPVNLCQASPKQMQAYRGSQISMIFQEPMSSLNPVYTCGFQLIEAIQQYHNVTKSEAENRVIASLQEVKLLPNDEELATLVASEQQIQERNAIARAVQQHKKSMLKRYPHQLSGGQLQRVMIAMAIACNPALLIADEPTTALDVTVQALILDLLRDLRDRRSMSMIFITHDLGTIAEIADDVAVMYRGKIVEYGPVDQIFAKPDHPYTKGLLACRPSPEHRFRKLPTVADYMQVQDEPDGEFKIFARHFNQDEASALTAEVSPEETTSRLEKLSSAPPLLTVQNLKVGYPVKGVFGQTTSTFMAVDDVSFDVYQGETFGLVGESGCGKTTLGRALLRLIEPLAGNVFFEGRSILQLSNRDMRKLRREMQVIFQDPFSSLDPRMSIGKAIAEPLKIHSVIRSRRNLKDRVAYLLERVDIDPNCVNRFPHEFSGGQRQRICIARALALNPKFIICDESVSALDVSVQAQVLNLLKELQAEFGLTYIFISHDLGVVKFMSDRIMVMNKGCLEELGAADEIYNNPQQAYTKQLIAAIPAGTLERIQELQLARIMVS